MFGWRLGFGGLGVKRIIGHSVDAALVNQIQVLVFLKTAAWTAIFPCFTGDGHGTEGVVRGLS